MYKHTNQIAYFSLLLIFATFIPSKSFAMGQCTKDGYTIVIINGMLTDEQRARNNKEALSQLMGGSYKNEKLNVEYLHNPSHLAGLGDLWDVTFQKAMETDIGSDYDLIEILNDASHKVTTQKLLLVGHSQGNFYVNNFYDRVVDKSGGVPFKSIKVYGVATPAVYVAGGGKYVTYFGDQVINKVRALGVVDVLPANLVINLPPDDKSNGHSFSDIYLKYQGARIVSDIKDSLAMLKSYDIENTDRRCLEPPELTKIHKAIGLGLEVADPLAVSTKYAAKGVYAIGTVTGKGIINGAKTLAHGVYDIGIAAGEEILNGTKVVANGIYNTTIDFANGFGNIKDSFLEAFSNAGDIVASNSNIFKADTSELFSDAIPVSPPDKNIKSAKPEATAPPLYIHIEDNNIGDTKSLPNNDSVVIPVSLLSVLAMDTSSVFYGGSSSGGGGDEVPEPPDIPPPPVEEDPPPAPPPAPPDVTAPDLPTVDAVPTLVNTNSIIITGTAEEGATVTISGGASTASGVVATGHYSITVDLNQNIANTLNITATDVAGNVSPALSVSLTHDNIPPVITRVLFAHSIFLSNYVVGYNIQVNIDADKAGYTMDRITINDIPVDSFEDITHGMYIVKRVIVMGETDRTSNTTPVSVVLKDAAGNTNTAYVYTGGLPLNGHAPTSIFQARPTFTPDGKFTEDVILDCISGSGNFSIYSIRDSDSTFRQNSTSDFTVNCPSGRSKLVDSGTGFADILGYGAVEGWYYGAISIGTPRCNASNNGRVCNFTPIQAFFRLHRDASGVWTGD